MELFSFTPPITLSEERNWLLARTSFELTNSVFIMSDENKSFSISTPGNCNTEDGEELINKVNKLLKLRSENDIELHVEEIRKRGNGIKLGENQ